MKSNILFSISILCLLFFVIGSVCAIDLGDVNNSDNLNSNQGDLIISSNENLDVSSGFISENTNVSNINENSYDVTPSLNTSDVIMYYHDGTRFYATLTDGSNPLVGMDITFTINNMNYTRQTDEFGVASIGLNLESGEYDITSTFNGYMNYSSISNTNTITILSTIVGEDIVKIYKNDTQYYVTCYDNSGIPLINTKVTFNINGVLYERTTDKDGKAKLSINLNPDNYIITSTNTVTGESISNNITVLSSIIGKNLTKYYGDDKKYSAIFYDKNGDLLANTDIKFNINGVLYTKRTDSNGVASLNINLYPNTYVITAFNPVNGQYYSNIVTILSTIVSEDIVKDYLNGTKFYVNILDTQGVPLKGASVSFNINGVFYYRTTDDNGLASLNINLLPNEYIITTTCNGESKSNYVDVIVAETVLNAEDIFVHVSKSGVFKAVLTYANGEPVSNQNVLFTLDEKTQTVKTDSNGEASIIISNMDAGDYEIISSFEKYGFESSYSINTIHIVDSYTVIIGEDLVMEYKDGSNFVVTLYDSINHTTLANESINFKINGAEYTRITNESGQASLKINLVPGIYQIDYSYSTPGSLYYSKGSNTIVVNKEKVTFVAKDIVIYPHKGDEFSVYVYDKNNNPIANEEITFIVSNVEYVIVTDKNGRATLAINLNAGIYPITYIMDTVIYYGEGVNTIIVNGTSFISQDVSIEYGHEGSFSVKIVDVYNNPVKDVLINFNVNNGEYKEKIYTGADGIASIKISSSYPVGVYPIEFSYNDFDGSEIKGLNHFTVEEPISLNDLLTASVNVRDYILSYSELPNYVTVGSRDVDMPTYLYLISVAIVNISKGELGNIPFTQMDEPIDPVEAENLGNLYTYVNFAQDVINYMDENGRAPDSLNCDLGNVGYDGIIYAFARVLAWYNEHGSLPTYTSIKSLSVSSSPLNDKNTITDLEPYLQATKNCQVDDAEIQALANQLTEGLTSDYAKAQAIFNYVRDQISYSFYYNSKYGAKGVLSSRTANCCDKAHLVVALARAADLPARYKHGVCTFSSGTYGHVWAQILVGDTWVVADATSPRNSFGEVINWDNYNYQLNGVYISLPF